MYNERNIGISQLPALTASRLNLANTYRTPKSLTSVVCGHKIFIKWWRDRLSLLYIETAAAAAAAASNSRQRCWNKSGWVGKRTISLPYTTPNMIQDNLAGKTSFKTFGTKMYYCQFKNKTHICKTLKHFCFTCNHGLIGTCSLQHPLNCVKSVLHGPTSRTSALYRGC